LILHTNNSPISVSDDVIIDINSHSGNITCRNVVKNVINGIEN